MSAELPWFKLLVDDVIKLYADLEADELGVLIRLHAHYWDVGWLPAEFDRLAKRGRVPVRTIKRMWPVLSPYFGPVDGDPSRIVALQLCDHRLLALTTVEALRVAGAKGGKTKAANVAAAIAGVEATVRPVPYRSESQERDFKASLPPARDPGTTGQGTEAADPDPIGMLVHRLVDPDGLWERVVNRDMGPGGYSRSLVAKILASAARQSPPPSFDDHASAMLRDFVAMCAAWRGNSIPATPTLRFFDGHFADVESWHAGERPTVRTGHTGRPSGRLPVTRIR